VLKTQWMRTFGYLCAMVASLRDSVFWRSSRHCRAGLSRPAPAALVLCSYPEMPLRTGEDARAYIASRQF